MSQAIEVRGLRREIKLRSKTDSGRKVLVALDDLNWEVHADELFGLLGPNGAGKTTLIETLSTLLLPTSGTARVDGLDVVTDPHRIRERINMAPGGGPSTTLYLLDGDHSQGCAQQAIISCAHHLE